MTAGPYRFSLIFGAENRLPAVSLFFTTILHLHYLFCVTAQAGSACSDLQEAADLCLEGSGSGDIEYEYLWDEDYGLGGGAKICRSSRLVTWFPDSSSGVDMTYMMVQSCRTLPEDSDTLSNSISASSGANRLSKCESVDQHVPYQEMAAILPVTSVSTNVTYFNHHCFLCSGDAGPEVTWSVNVTCSRWVELQSLGSEHEVLRAALNSPYCRIMLQPPPGVGVKTCEHPDTIPPPPTQLPDSTHLRTQHFGAPLSLLLNFRGPRTPPGGEQGEDNFARPTLSCFEEEFFLYAMSRCVPVKCEAGKRLVVNECHSVIQLARGFSYALTLNLDAYVIVRGVRKGNPKASLKSQCSLDEVLKSGVINKMPLLHSDAYSLVARVLSEQNSFSPTTDFPDPESDDDLYFQENLSPDADDYVSSESSNSDEDEERNESFLWGTLAVWLDFVVTEEVEREEVESSALRMSSQDWHVTCGEMHVRLVPTLRRRPYGSDPAAVIPNTSLPDKRMFWENVSKQEYKNFFTQTDRTTLTVSPFLLCPFLVFLPQDYVVLETDTSKSNVSVFNVSVSLPETDYRIDQNGKLELCRNTFIRQYLVHLTGNLNYTENNSSSEESLIVTIEQYLSLACVSLSLFGLMATFVTYSLFRSLRTIPGKNAMSLCANLFLAQALLQFGAEVTDDKSVCMVVGMLVHYSWLASLLWMNVCSFHMRRVFTAKPSSAMTSEHARGCSRRIAAYVLYAQGVPAFVVGATAATSILVSGGRNVGYGGTVCYLATPFLVGVAFVLPLALVIVLNMVFFFQAVKAIARDVPVAHHRGGQPLHVQNGDHRSRGGVKVVPSSWRRNLNVCARLSSLTGLFWTLGLLAEVLDIPILRLVSDVVNGLQGVLIAASYLPTRRVAHLYRHAFCTCCSKTPRATAISRPATSAGDSNNSTSNATNSTTVSNNTMSSGIGYSGHWIVSRL